MRTRFAPSPTGLLHIGGLRTALYCYLVAEQSGSDFIVRVEDTDQERSVDGAIENMLQTLHWAGVEPSEGVLVENGSIVQKGDKGPYIQSQRLDIYKKHAEQLIDSGHAYYAFDSKEEIDRMREEQTAAGVASPRYDSSIRLRMCNSLTLDPAAVEKRIESGEDYVIRLKVPESGSSTCTDIVRGKVEFQHYTVDDAVLLKSDGFPTYHLANVVDDHLMEIELVLRGEEWLPSLPKHILLYEAFGWEPPQFAHVPLLLNADKSKLSKRQNDVAVQDYIDQGYLREALINFVALLGWNPGSTKEIFTMEELIADFSMERIQKSGAVFDREKLDWLQGQWMRSFSLEEFVARVRPIVAEVYPAAADDTDFPAKAALIQERITFFHEAPEMLSYYYSEPTVTMEILANKKQKVTEQDVPQLLQLLVDTLQEIKEDDWKEEYLKDRLFSLAEEKGLKLGQILWPLRAALTGLPYSPGAFEVAAVLGKTITLDRLNKALSL